MPLGSAQAHAQFETVDQEQAGAGLRIQLDDLPDMRPGPGQPACAEIQQRHGQQALTLVARGRTDAQIAAQLVISIRTVRSHLDRIRDKTGYRRRADLTRLALKEKLV